MMGKSRNLADAEERFVNTAGDTMTGALQIDGAPANLNLRDTRAATNGLVQVGTRGVNGEIAIIDVDPNNAVSNSNLRFNMDDVERVRIDSAGNVGVGTSSPSQRLDVNGTANATNLTRGGSQVYSRNNILGTVSQSSGVPTGAVIESGSNANGDFVKYADGTLICHRNFTSGITMSAYSTGLSQGSISATAPAASVQHFRVTGGGNNQSTQGWAAKSSDTSGTEFRLMYFSNAGTVTGTALHLIGFGRWF